MEGIPCNSMEGFLQSLKFKDANMQVEICKLVGGKAKSSGKNKNWQKTQTLWWRGEPIKRDSQQYQDLLDTAYTSLFSQNSKAKKALLASRNATLKHSIGRSKVSETILTKREFCSRLTELRTYLQQSELMDI